MGHRCITLTALLVLTIAQGLAAQPGRVVIVQTNAAGDNLHLIDSATNKVVGEIGGIEVNHGVAAAPDGRFFYVSNEAEHRLDVVDGHTLKTTKSREAERTTEQRRHQQERSIRLRGHRRGPRRGGRDRHELL